MGAAHGLHRGRDLARACARSPSTSRRSSSRCASWRCGSPARSPPPACSRDRLELEITEAVLIRDDETALAILHQLRALGVRIALDDFGTGYSSLSYLQRFPFDKIKIDRSFVADIAEADGSPMIVQAVVNIAAARNMTTVAEGVETAAAARIAARARLHPDAGLSVLRRQAGRRVAAAAGTDRESAHTGLTVPKI